MKVISGGGWFEADGTHHELPTVEREVSDEYFQKMRDLFKAVPDPRQPSVVSVSPAIYAALKAAR